MAAEAATGVSEAVDTQALDAWLAEHLLGGPRANPGWYWFRGTGETDGFPDIDVPGQEPLFSGPKLSTTGDGMLMVERAIVERGWQIVSGWDNESPCWARIVTETAVPIAKADSLPEAVALAARAALEAENA